jgi:DNA-binding IclR family transcriptional regulator
MTDTKAPAIARAAAILYVLRALAEEELVAFDPDTKRYSLDAGVLTLARGWLRRNQFADVAQPLIDKLARDHGLTMLAVQIVGLEHIVVIATAQGGMNFQLSAQIGSRFPALISATGRCIAAFGRHPPAEVEKRFKMLRWDNPPPLTDWLEQVEQTRVHGYAVDVGNYITGVTVIAAPVLKETRSPSHALVAVGISGAVERTGARMIGEDLYAATRALAQRLNAD